MWWIVEGKLLMSADNREAALKQLRSVSILLTEPRITEDVPPGPECGSSAEAEHYVRGLHDEGLPAQE